MGLGDAIKRMKARRETKRDVNKGWKDKERDKEREGRRLGWEARKEKISGIFSRDTSEGKQRVRAAKRESRSAIMTAVISVSGLILMFVFLILIIIPVFMGNWFASVLYAIGFIIFLYLYTKRDSISGMSMRGYEEY